MNANKDAKYNMFLPIWLKYLARIFKKELITTTKPDFSDFRQSNLPNSAMKKILDQLSRSHETGTF